MLVLVGGRHLARHSQNPTESSYDQDRHKAPAHPHVRPLSLQVRRRFRLFPLRSSKFIRTLGRSHDPIWLAKFIR